MAAFSQSGFCEILDPAAFADHKCADCTFDQIHRLRDCVKRKDGYRGKPAQAESQGDAYRPNKATVEQEGDQCLTAGAQGKIGGIDKGVDGHKNGTYAEPIMQ